LAVFRARPSPLLFATAAAQAMHIAAKIHEDRA
jgi:hypothetical protein